MRRSGDAAQKPGTEPELQHEGDGVDASPEEAEEGGARVLQRHGDLQAAVEGDVEQHRHRLAGDHDQRQPAQGGVGAQHVPGEVVGEVVGLAVNDGPFRPGLVKGPVAECDGDGGQRRGADDDLLRADALGQDAGEHSAQDRAHGRNGDDHAVPALAVVGRELAVDERPRLLDDQDDVRLGEDVEHEGAAGDMAAGGEGGRRQHQSRTEQGDGEGGGGTEMAQQPADQEGEGHHGQRHQHQRLGQAAGAVVGQEHR